jgi:hypothetical protein
MRWVLGLSIVVFAAGCGSEDPLRPKPTVAITVVEAAAAEAPIDATPDPAGTTIFFLATSAGEPGVFSVPASGGEPAAVFSGPPLAAPRSLTISSDGTTLFVADPEAGDGGVIFSLAASGESPPEELADTAGKRPTAVEIGPAQMEPEESLYFAGTSSAGPAVFELASGSAISNVLSEGMPLIEPDGIAIASDGTAYVADRAGGEGAAGQVFKVSGGRASLFGPEFRPGTPAGIALSLDETQLLLSSIDDVGRSQVVLLGVPTTIADTFSEVIDQNIASGGIHRARTRDQFAWSGYNRVYNIGRDGGAP